MLKCNNVLKYFLVGSSTLLVLIAIILVILFKLNIVLPWTSYPGSTNSFTSIETVETEIANAIVKEVTLLFEEGDYVLDMRSCVIASAKVDKPSLLDWLSSSTLDYHITYEYDEDRFCELLDEAYLPCVDSKIVLNADGTFDLEPEQYNRDFNASEVKDLIIQAFDQGQRVVDLRDFCKEPEYLKSDLEYKYNEIKWINDFKIEYTNGTKILPKDLHGCWNDDLSFDLSKANFSEVEKSLKEFYSDDNKSLSFKTTNGASVEVPYKTFGNYLDFEKEMEYIESLIGTPKEAWNRSPYTYGYGSFTDTYVEVSIKDQHLWHYVDGKMCCDTDIVTGTLGKHDTPIGVYYVSEMIPGKYLRGTGYVTWVNRWMRLTNTGIGLHDATWRNKFGESIYQRSGSHGCINLPKDFAYNLYSELERGTTVVIYNE